MSWRCYVVLGVLSTLLPAAVAGSALAQDACNDPRRVVGGEDADIKDHPWQVALSINGGVCGGSIVAQNWVLTAAHCFKKSTQPGEVRVKAGATNRSIGGAWTAIERIVVHKEYNGDPYWPHNDLALVKLKTRPPGQIIPLAPPDLKLEPCQFLEVTGWGRTTEGGSTSEKLQKAQVPYVESAICNGPDAYKGKVLPHMMCAGFRDGGVDSCQGDSGGPLVLKGKDGAVLVGVVSWGEGCAQKLRYGVYTRVANFRGWITEVIASDRKR